MIRWLFSSSSSYSDMFSRSLHDTLYFHHIRWIQCHCCSMWSLFIDVNCIWERAPHGWESRKNCFDISNSINLTGKAIAAMGRLKTKINFDEIKIQLLELEDKFSNGAESTSSSTSCFILFTNTLFSDGSSSSMERRQAGSGNWFSRTYTEAVESRSEYFFRYNSYPIK